MQSWDRPKKSFTVAQAKIVKSVLKSGTIKKHPMIDDLVLLDRAQIRAIKKR